jgi:hypothetical protein
VGLGKRDACVNACENWDEGRENVRQAVAGMLLFFSISKSFIHF